MTPKVFVEKERTPVKRRGSASDDLSDTPVQLNAYMCKTSQVKGAMSKSIFYKRFYTFNKQTNDLIIRLKPD